MTVFQCSGYPNHMPSLRELSKSFYRTSAKGALQSKPISQMSRKERRAVRHTLEQSRDMRRWPDTFSPGEADQSFTTKKVKRRRVSRKDPRIRPRPRPATFREKFAWKKKSGDRMIREARSSNPPKPGPGTVAYAAPMGWGKNSGTRIVTHRGRARKTDRMFAERGYPRDQDGRTPSQRTAAHEREHAKHQQKKGAGHTVQGWVNDRDAVPVTQVKRKGVLRRKKVIPPSEATRKWTNAEAGAQTPLSYAPHMGGYDGVVGQHAIRPGSMDPYGKKRGIDPETLMQTRKKILDRVRPDWKEDWRRSKSGKIGLSTTLGGDAKPLPRVNMERYDDKGLKGKVYRGYYEKVKTRRVKRYNDKLFGARDEWY